MSFGVGIGHDSRRAGRMDAIGLDTELPKANRPGSSWNSTWFTPSLRDIRMLRIEGNTDLGIALDDDDD